MRFNVLSTCSGTLPRAQDPVWVKLNSWLSTICLARKKFMIQSKFMLRLRRKIFSYIILCYIIFMLNDI